MAPRQPRLSLLLAYDGSRVQWVLRRPNLPPPHQRAADEAATSKCEERQTTGALTTQRPRCSRCHAWGSAQAPHGQKQAQDAVHQYEMEGLTGWWYSGKPCLSSRGRGSIHPSTAVSGSQGGLCASAAAVLGQRLKYDRSNMADRDSFYQPRLPALESRKDSC